MRIFSLSLLTFLISSTVLSAEVQDVLSRGETTRLLVEQGDNPWVTVVLFAGGKGVMKISESGSSGNDGVAGHVAPQPLPDGRAILYMAYRGTGSNPSVALYIPESGEHQILADGMRPWFASSGHVVYSGIGGGTLWALPFDVDRLEIL